MSINLASLMILLLLLAKLVALVEYVTSDLTWQELVKFNVLKEEQIGIIGQK